jgi:F1F0 ATPase subunit 2
MNWMAPIDVVLYPTAGAALGTVYFVLLLRTVHLHAAQVMTIYIIPLYLLRFGMVASAFWIIAQQGALPLLLTLLGFLIARLVIQRWKGSE